MSSHNVLENMTSVTQSREVVFAGDGVRLAGQIDYPGAHHPPAGNPLIFILHHAGGNTRHDYQHYADIALEMGCAVFRWDKRGTGSSGAGGRGSALQDAVSAYRHAIAQPGLNTKRTIILAQGEGTLMLSDIFDDLSAAEHPYAALLVANMLDKQDILAIKTRLQIIIGENDWISWRLYGKEACDAHNAAYEFGARFSVAHHADRLLIDTRYPGKNRFHIGAKQIIRDWLAGLG